MRRWLWLSMFLMVILVAIAGAAFAQEADDLPVVGERIGFVDNDGDGVCDNCGQGSGNPNAPRVNFVDANGDGVCDNCTGNGPMGPGGGARRGQRTGVPGPNFIDENGDGVCDLQGTAQGPNFVDENNDGICDNARQGRGQGRGQGSRGRWGN